jgi:hypothetical protein
MPTFNILFLGSIFAIFQCKILARHGARSPTLVKASLYDGTIDKIKSNVKRFTGDYAFLADFRYTLGSDQLTAFGEQQMIYAGWKFYKRYAQVARTHSIFIRASGQQRVMESAQKFAEGYHRACIDDKNANKRGDYPYHILVLPEGPGRNNTLSHSLCEAFEVEKDHAREVATAQWLHIFVSPIQKRLNDHLPGADLSQYEVLQLMDLCPFHTVSLVGGQISPFCKLFSEEEWHQYDYFQSLGKYYGFGNGNSLGPTQGVGFVNELIARLTNAPVKDQTSTNSTLDSSNDTFPTGPTKVLFADFSHDNDIVAILSALGLYNNTMPLPKSSMRTPQQLNGFAASWIVPFAARAYIEKLRCQDSAQSYVRVIINDRVSALTTCGGDFLGRCKLSDFVESLSFAENGGLWSQCFE